MRKSDELETTGNSNVYKKLHWRKIALDNCLCPICGPHYFENASKQAWRKRERAKQKFNRSTIRKPGN